MKINNFIKFVFIILCAAAFIAACEKAGIMSTDNSVGNNYVIDSIYANGSEGGAGTTALTITVNDDRLVLTADDIIINAVFPLIKGGINKTDTAKTYELSITPGGTGIIRVGLDPYRGFTGWDAKTAVVYAEWFFSGTSELTITGCSLPAFPSDKIPLEIAGLPVIAIGNMAFYGEGLTKVIIDNIENGIKVIGDGAFAVNQLTEIVIPESVTTIGSGAFESNKLSHVIIPKNVTVIRDSTFADNLLKYIVISENVTYIGDEAFAFNELTYVVIPKSVVFIGNGAFTDNRLKNIKIPDSVKIIQNHAFIDNPLKSIVIGENAALERYSFGNGFERAYYGNEGKKGTYTFNGDTWDYDP